MQTYAQVVAERDQAIAERVILRFVQEVGAALNGDAVAALLALSHGARHGSRRRRRRVNDFCQWPRSRRCETTPRYT